ncbi:MAG: hypothetical protein R2751_18860 [Bacteroidales bacterium]
MKNLASLFLSGRFVLSLLLYVLADRAPCEAQESSRMASWGEVIVSELLADPVPAVVLEDEFVELHNCGTRDLDLTGWVLTVNESAKVVDTLVLEAGGFRVVPSPRLPNDGAELGLWDAGGRLIHGTRYGGYVAGAPWKQEGGWSMEWVWPEQPCYREGGWAWSEDPSGGTPGRVNSVVVNGTDDIPPACQSLGSAETGGFVLHLSEALAPEALSTGRFRLQPGNLAPLDLRLSQPVGDRIYLDFGLPADSWSGKQLVVQLPSDCSGNPGDAFLRELTPPKAPGPSAVLINEILYDPGEFGEEFVELHNPGPFVTDLTSLCLDVTSEGEGLQKPVPLAEDSHWLFPGEYLVCCADPATLREAYRLERWIRVVNLPSWKALPNAGGEIHLTDRTGAGVDRAVFRDDMHHPALDLLQGVSLERMSAHRPANDPANWHSASAARGYATPGTENSQSLDGTTPGEGIRIHPVVFSPDNDGQDDVLVLQADAALQGCLLDVWVFDLEGRERRTLANNELAGTSVVCVWDGRDSEGHLLPEGYYVILFHAWNAGTGQQVRRRFAVGLVYP